MEEASAVEGKASRKTGVGKKEIRSDQRNAISIKELLAWSEKPQWIVLSVTDKKSNK
jgi:hypothetical protein